MCPVRQIPGLKSIGTIEVMSNLIYYREQAQVKSMGKLMQKKIMEEGKPFFDVWMYEVSDDIQNLATAFAERWVLEQAIAARDAMTDCPKAQVVLDKVIYLHCINEIKKNLGWFMTEGCIGQEAALEVPTLFEKAVKDYVPHMNTCVEALGVVQQKHLIGPVARDYVAFNAQNNNENYKSAGDVFNFRTTGQPRAKL